MPGVSTRRVVAAALAVLAPLVAPVVASAQVVDDFESYLLGTLPAPLWLDAGAVLPTPPVPPFPSAFVISTTNAFGAPTQAVTTVGAVATSKGIYTSVPISSFYSLHADVRVDRYADNPANPASDWAMQLTFGQNGVENWAFTPSAGIYASSLTGGWRIYVIALSNIVDIDLGVPATVGTWYTVSQTLDVNTGQFHSRIVDAATGTVLTDQFHVIPGWVPGEARYDAFAFVGGDTSPLNTVGNIGVVDNVNVSAVPEPSTVALVGLGLLALGAGARRRR
jgi:hypothetical protein